MTTSFLAAAKRRNAFMGHYNQRYKKLPTTVFKQASSLPFLVNKDEYIIVCFTVVFVICTNGSTAK